jgi:hypothetical protein
MKRPSRPRTTAELSKSLHRQLNSYAFAATAAGVGMLALAQPAAAEIIYTPTNVDLDGNYALDLNHDGITDFHLACGHSLFSQHVSLLLVYEHNTNRFLGSKGKLHVPDDLAAGFVIGAWARSRFSNRNSSGIMAEIATSTNMRTGYVGLWANGGKGVKNRYLGLKFKINGEFHYGWARLNVSFPHGSIRLKAVLTGYAYETIPGKAIVAGKTKGPDVVVEPATLGHLAAGASAIPAWR